MTRRFLAIIFFSIAANSWASDVESPDIITQEGHLEVIPSLSIPLRSYQLNKWRVKEDELFISIYEAASTGKGFKFLFTPLTQNDEIFTEARIQPINPTRYECAFFSESKVIFDLRPLKEAYFKMEGHNQDTRGSVNLKIENYPHGREKEIITISYSFAK